jgi:hypothetical protein
VSVPSSPPKRITLQLIPKNTKVSNLIATAGYNPLLQLTYAAKKPISYIIKHMMKKWTREVDGTEVRNPPLSRLTRASLCGRGSRADC